MLKDMKLGQYMHLPPVSWISCHQTSPPKKSTWYIGLTTDRRRHCATYWIVRIYILPFLLSSSACTYIELTKKTVSLVQSSTMRLWSWWCEPNMMCFCFPPGTGFFRYVLTRSLFSIEISLSVLWTYPLFKLGREWHSLSWPPKLLRVPNSTTYHHPLTNANKKLALSHFQVGFIQPRAILPGKEICTLSVFESLLSVF